MNFYKYYIVINDKIKYKFDFFYYNIIFFNLIMYNNKKNLKHIILYIIYTIFLLQNILEKFKIL